MTKGRGGIASSPGVRGALGALAVTACAATGGWENPHVPKERWVADEATCRRLVEAPVERQHARDPLTRDPLGAAFESGRIGLGYDRGPDAWASRMARYEAGKLRTRLIAQCMTERGYTRRGAAKKS